MKKNGVGSAAFALIAGCGSATQDLGQEYIKIDSVRAVAAAPALTNTYILTDKGAVLAWGSGRDGALGNGNGDYRVYTGDDSVSPVRGLSSDVVSVSAANGSACAVTSNGALWCWGTPLGVDPAQNEIASDETAFRSEPAIAGGLSAGVASVETAGGHLMCSLMQDGHVKCFGQSANQEGVVPVDVAGLDDASDLSFLGGPKALTRSGAVYTFSPSNETAPTTFAGLESGISAISGTCALTRSGTVKCWGNYRGSVADTANDHDILDVTDLTDVAEIAGEDSHTCALRSNGEVKCWGEVSWGGVDNPEESIAVVKRSLVPMTVPGMESGIVSISVAHHHTCGVRDNGRVACVYSCYSNRCNLQKDESRLTWK